MKGRHVGLDCSSCSNRQIIVKEYKRQRTYRFLLSCLISLVYTNYYYLKKDTVKGSILSLPPQSKLARKDAIPCSI